MKGFIKWVEGWPRVVKLLFTLIWGIFPNLYRIGKSLSKGNLIGTILAIILLICGGFLILWIIDIFTMLFANKVLWFD